MRDTGAQGGKRDALIDFLKGVQAGAIKSGCHSIAVHSDSSTDDEVVEIEYWDRSDDHKKFVGAAAKAGAFEPFGELLAAPFEISCCVPAQKTEA